ncbi:hypothetical protein Q9189_001894 [Teloschistes chrysophthalmus]
MTPSVTEAVAQAPTASALAFILNPNFWAHMVMMAVFFLPVHMTIYVELFGVQSRRTPPNEMVRLHWRSIAWKALVSSTRKGTFGCAFVRDCFKMAHGEAMKKNKLLKTGLTQAWGKVEKLTKARGIAEKLVKDLEDEISNKLSAIKEAEAANAELIKAFFLAQDELKLASDKAVEAAYQDGWSAGYSQETERSKRERNKAYEQGAIEQTCALSRDLKSADDVLEGARLRIRVLRKIAFKSMAGSNKALEEMTNRVSLYKALFRMTRTTSVPQLSANEIGRTDAQ